MRHELDSLVTEMYEAGFSYAEAVLEFRRGFVLQVLSANWGNQCKAAHALGVHRNTISRMLRELSIDYAQVREGLKLPCTANIPSSRRSAAAAVFAEGQPSALRPFALPQLIVRSSAKEAVAVFSGCRCRDPSN